MLLKIENLSKNYKKKEVLHNINFSIQKDEVLCFLGPNGAGKSTMINILTGSLPPTSGNIFYQNKSIYQNLQVYKQHLGIVPQDLALYEELTAERNILFFTSLYGLTGTLLHKVCEYALEFTGLTKHRNEKVKTFSGGMKRRLNIACAIAHKPQILIMDEPTVGIDPQSRDHILEQVKRLASEGTTILYTTHYMEEVEKISTRILIMDQGKIIAEGSKEKLKEKYENEQQYYIQMESTKEVCIDSLLSFQGVKKVDRKDRNTLVITTDQCTENLDLIIGYLLKKEVKIKDISCEVSTLETVFLKMTGKSLRD